MQGSATERRMPLLLGEAPSRTGDRYHAFPLSGRPARALCELAGIPPQAEGSTYGRWTWALYEHLDCENVFERYAEATPWSASIARDLARIRIDELRTAVPEIPVPGDRSPRYPVVVCLGRKVQAAVAGALSGAVDMRTTSGAHGVWGDRCFGDYGCWAPPWQVRPREDGVDRWAPWVVTIPHPSGLNRLLNDPETRERCGAVLRRAMFLADMDARVDEWHDSGPEEVMELHEFLGLTWDEYRAIV